MPMTDINQIREAMRQTLIQFHIAACTELPDDVQNADITIEYDQRAAKFTLEWNGFTAEVTELNSQIHRKAEKHYQEHGKPSEQHENAFKKEEKESKKSEVSGSTDVKDRILKR